MVYELARDSVRMCVFSLTIFNISYYTVCVNPANFTAYTVYNTFQINVCVCVCVCHCEGVRKTGVVA